MVVLVKNRFGAVRVYIWRLFGNNGMSAEMKISQKMGGAKQKLPRWRENCFNKAFRVFLIGV